MIMYPEYLLKRLPKEALFHSMFTSVQNPYSCGAYLSSRGEELTLTLKQTSVLQMSGCAGETKQRK